MNRFLSALLWLSCLILAPVWGAEQQPPPAASAATPVQLFEQLAQTAGPAAAQPSGQQGQQSQQIQQLSQQAQQLEKDARQFADRTQKLAELVGQLQQRQTQAQQSQPQPAQTIQQAKADITPQGWKLMDQRRDIEKNGNVYVAKYQREDYTSLGKKPNSSRHLAIIIGGPNPQTVKEACQRELQALRSEDPMGFRLMRKVSPNAVIITQGDTDTQGFNDDQILEARGEVSSSQNELNRWMNQSVRTMTAPAGRQPTPSDQSKTNPSKPTGGQTKP